ncbi:MAG: hypothetical protein SGI97_06980 [candidate division Zixibacteria bacterium]|nr:hypothetical protein [candidate division Zixibacteria bacterium]
MKKPACLLLILALVLSLSVLASKARILNFSPPPKVNYTMITTTERLQITPGERQVDSTIIVSNHTLEKSNSGYVLHTKFTSQRSLRNGRSLDNPLELIFASLETSMDITAEGFASGINGYEKLPAVIDSIFPPDTAGALKSALSVEEMSAREVGEWNGRAANLVDRVVSLDSKITDTAFYLMPEGASQKYYILSRLMDTLRLQGKWCVQTKITAATSPKELASISGLSLKAIVDLFHIPDTVLQRYPAGRGVMRLTTEMLVEMETLLMRSEKTVREIEYGFEVDSTGSRYLGKSVETRAVRYQY